MRSRLAILLVAGLVGFGACSSDDADGTIVFPEVCTLIGCRSGVTWLVDDVVSAPWPRPIVLEACIDHRCEATQIAVGQRVASHRARVDLYEGIDVAAGHTVALRVTGPDGSVLLEREEMVTLTAVHPNGPACPPTCWQASILVGPTG